MGGIFKQISVTAYTKITMSTKNGHFSVAVTFASRAWKIGPFALTCRPFSLPSFPTFSWNLYVTLRKPHLDPEGCSPRRIFDMFSRNVLCRCCISSGAVLSSMHDVLFEMSTAARGLWKRSRELNQPKQMSNPLRVFPSLIPVPITPPNGTSILQGDSGGCCVERQWCWCVAWVAAGGRGRGVWGRAFAWSSAGDGCRRRVREGIARLLAGRKRNSTFSSNFLSKWSSFSDPIITTFKRSAAFLTTGGR